MQKRRRTAALVAAAAIAIGMAMPGVAHAQPVRDPEPSSMTSFGSSAVGSAELGRVWTDFLWDTGLWNVLCVPSYPMGSIYSSVWRLECI